ncbi:MAG TPA: hypothetical protein DEB50_09380 [Desulfobacter sp.]|nr:hypothetical protein [Desulfobacter sp.]
MILPDCQHSAHQEHKIRKIGQKADDDYLFFLQWLGESAVTRGVSNPRLRFDHKSSPFKMKSV